MFQPAIKWSGSKRSQATEIVGYFPMEIDTFYEPFCGGASVTRALIESEVKVNKIVCSDNNKGLIDLWKVIKAQPTAVAEGYKHLWNELNKKKDINGKRLFFEYIRARYNATRHPIDFFFIMRTTENGMPRYNAAGQFNNSFHITRNGMAPERAEAIIMDWSEMLNKNDVTFKCVSYEEIHPTENDFMYLDPPYAHTKGMYHGKFDNVAFFEWLRGVKCRCALSYDGISGGINNTFQVPRDIFKRHFYLRSGNSSFKRVIGKSNDSIVYESLYLNY